jgi:[Skp1-protein]-hydroxyproline N-acetylglucosaminyltransferase
MENLYIIIFIICIFIIIFQLLYLENFDEGKINTGEKANERIKEFEYEKFKPYIEKYFKPINIIDLKTIPVNKNSLIFCSVASYRDKQCPLTIMDMIKKAKNPQNLVICINQQNAENDIDCFENQNFEPAKIKIIKYTDREARGPCWARYLIQQEWKGEEYFLQIDSHMRFIEEWDQICIDQLKLLPEKSCLTNYVSNFNLDLGKPDDDNQLRGPLYIVNKETSDADGFFRVNSDFINSADKPLLAKGWSACFSFSGAEILHDAPYDPYTPFLFFGEEMDIWARMWSRGWKVYAPSTPICFTSFDRSYRATFWEHPDQMLTDYLSRLRLYYKFGYLNDIHEDLKISLEHYDLDKSKTWREFLEYCLDDIEEKIS